MALLPFPMPCTDCETSSADDLCIPGERLLLPPTPGGGPARDNPKAASAKTTPFLLQAALLRGEDPQGAFLCALGYPDKTGPATGPGSRIAPLQDLRCDYAYAYDHFGSR